MRFSWTRSATSLSSCSSAFISRASSTSSRMGVFATTVAARRVCLSTPISPISSPISVSRTTFPSMVISATPSAMMNVS